MEIIKLTKEDIIYIYYNHYSFDFADNERKPLNNLLELMDTDQYYPYGLIEDLKIIGYAYFFKHENIMLLDYFAIIKEKRNQGYGTYFLSTLLKTNQDLKIFLEAENPDVYQTEEATKRIAFYKKIGLQILPYQLKMYYVDYWLLASQQMTFKEVDELYHDIYPLSFIKKYMDLTKNRMH